MGNPYAAQDESSSALRFDRLVLIGGFFGCIAYGLHIILAVACVRALVHDKTLRHRRRNAFTISFVLTLFVLATLNLAFTLDFFVGMFVDNRLFPGGPSQYIQAEFSNLASQFQNVTFTVANLLVDGLLVFRLFVIYGKSFAVAIVPVLLYMGVAAMSIISIYGVAQPNAVLWNHFAPTLADLLYFSMSVSLNLLVTVLIISRLLYLSIRAKRMLGAEHARTYTSIAAMMVESALPYTVLFLALVICFAQSYTSASQFLVPCVSQFMCICPDMIIYRVAQGRGWSQKTTAQVSTGLVAPRREIPLATLQRSTTTKSDAPDTRFDYFPNEGSAGAKRSLNV